MGFLIFDALLFPVAWGIRRFNVDNVRMNPELLEEK